jgi:hypothetical protein
MTHTLTLYLGHSEACRTARHTLQRWSSVQTDITLTVESIHLNPAAALRLHITALPALVLDNTVIAQGQPERWLTTPFLEALAARLNGAHH